MEPFNNTWIYRLPETTPWNPPAIPGYRLPETTPWNPPKRII